MKVSLKNIGLLNEAEFDVGDLTIICGENNTGKTYATYSLYGYLQLNSFANNGENFYSYSLEIIKKNINNFKIDGFNLSVEKECFLKMLQELEQAIQNRYILYLPELLASNAENFLQSNFKEHTLSNLHKYFAKIIDNINDMNKFFSNFGADIKSVDGNIIVFDISFYKNIAKNDSLNSSDFFIIQLIRYILLSKYPRAFILSAERTGASMFYKELDVNKNEVLEQINNMSGKNIDIWDLLDKRYSRYPKPVKDNIYFIRELDEISKRKSFIVEDEKSSLYNEIIGLLFNIVGGKYIVGSEGISFAPGAKKRATKGKFPVQTSSSSVRALMILSYYILNYCDKNDILMIDEPELNLHPNNQILIGRLLVLLVNAGIKVFITTHSDYIIREISNCIMLNNLSDKQLLNFKNTYKTEYKLDFSKVKAYLAENNDGKNQLKQVKIDKNSGIFMETFNKSIDDQNNLQGLIFESVIKSNLDNKNDK
ncbi:AAA family ATPase [Campylobacter mucosalis]|uniref:AAA family ATPase n=1 Tax=Campylobacter mucosalis TaxID=202 RepID=UPI00146FD46D|nr:AAA family ATPase [Campylobacter mucosalis]